VVDEHRPSIACSAFCIVYALFLNCFSVLDAKVCSDNIEQNTKKGNIRHTARNDRSSCVLLQTWTYRVWHRGVKLPIRTLCGECPDPASANTMADTVAL